MIAARVFSVAVLIVTGGTLDAQVQLRRYDFDPAESHLYVVTHRSGVFAGVFGHEHVISPRDWSGAFCWSPDAPLSAHGLVHVNARTLEIDDAAMRKIAGLGGGPSEGQLKNIRSKFVDEQHLDTARYGEIRIDLPTAAEAGTDRVVMNGRLTIKDATRDIALPLQLSRLAQGGMRVSGTLTVRQSDYGIKPESIAGVVKVKDPIDIHFNGIAKPSAGACPLSGTQ